MGFAMAGTIGAWARYRQPNLLLAWKPFIITQHQFDYQLEFVKRGFTGELLRLTGIARTVGAISIVSWVILVVLALAFIAFFRIASRQSAPATDRDSKSLGGGAAIWLWTVVSSPAIFLQAGGDLGRLDPLLLLYQVALLALVFVEGWVALIASTLITISAVATHELFLLAQLPIVIVGCLFLAAQQPSRVRSLVSRAAVLAGAGMIAAAAIALHGRMESMPLSEYLEFLRHHRSLAEPNVEGAEVLYKSLGANIGYAWAQLSAKAPRGIPVCAVAMLAFMAAGFAAVRWRRPCMLLISTAGISPLLLLFLAYDYGRWFSFSVANILLAVALCQADATLQMRWISLRWIWPLSVLGPFGVTIGFPWWL